MITKTILFIFLLIPGLNCLAKQNPEQYFVLNNDTKQNFTKFDHLGGDTVYFMNDSSLLFLPADSIKIIHIYSSPHTLRGGIIGLVSGFLTGALLGSAAGGDDSYGSIGGAEAGAYVGAVVGTGIGLLAGANSGKKVDFHLQQHSKEMRLKLIPIVLAGD